MTITIPGLPPTPNSRQGTCARIGTARKWRTWVTWAWRADATMKPPPMWWPNLDAMRVTVTLTRVRRAGPPLDAEDNLPASFKSVRDAVAGLLFRGCVEHDAGGAEAACSRGGHHDSDPRITWRYNQTRGPAACVEITIEEVTDG